MGTYDELNARIGALTGYSCTPLQLYEPHVATKLVGIIDELEGRLGKRQAQEQPAGEWTELVAAVNAYRNAEFASGERLTKAVDACVAAGVVTPRVQPAGETERVAKAFEVTEELNDIAVAAFHSSDSEFTEDSMILALEAASKHLATVGPTEREKELEAALKLSHEATEAAVMEWNAKEAELAQAKETIASLQLDKIDSATELEGAEVELANEQQCNQCLSEMLTARDSELAELRAKLKGAREVYRIRGNECEEQHRVIVQLRAKLAECERAMEPLSEKERHSLEMVSKGRDLEAIPEVELTHVGRLARALLRRCPRPAPVDPIRALIETWRTSGHYGEPYKLAANQLERALAQKEQGR